MGKIGGDQATLSLLRKGTNMRLLLLLAVFLAALTVSFGSPVPQRGRRPGKGPGRGPPGRRPPPPNNNNNGFTGPFGANLGTVATAGTAGFVGGLAAQPVSNFVGGLLGGR